MKKMVKTLAALAALALVGSAFVSCSSEEEWTMDPSTYKTKSPTNDGQGSGKTYDLEWNFGDGSISAITNYSKTKNEADVDLDNGLKLLATTSSHTYAANKGLSIKGDNQMSLSGITGKVKVTVVAYMNSNDTAGRTVTVKCGSDSKTTKSFTAQKETDTIELVTTVADGGTIDFSSVGEVYVTSITCKTTN